MKQRIKMKKKEATQKKERQQHSVVLESTMCIKMAKRLRMSLLCVVVWFIFSRVRAFRQLYEYHNTHEIPKPNSIIAASSPRKRCSGSVLFRCTWECVPCAWLARNGNFSLRFFSLRARPAHEV